MGSLRAAGDILLPTGACHACEDGSPAPDGGEFPTAQHSNTVITRARTVMVRALGLERVTGIEPALSAWEAEVLPLNYTRVAPVDVRPRCVRKSNPDSGRLRKSACGGALGPRR